MIAEVKIQRDSLINADHFPNVQVRPVVEVDSCFDAPYNVGQPVERMIRLHSDDGTKFRQESGERKEIIVNADQAPTALAWSRLLRSTLYEL
jgi:hypothetical protein